MLNSILGKIIQVFLVAIFSGFYTYFLGNSFRGHVVMAFGLLGIPVLVGGIANLGILAKALMAILLTFISIFVAGYVAIFMLGYY